MGKGGRPLCPFLYQACHFTTSSTHLPFGVRRVGKKIGKILEHSFPFMHEQGHCYTHPCSAFLLHALLPTRNGQQPLQALAFGRAGWPRCILPPAFLLCNQRGKLSLVSLPLSLQTWLHCPFSLQLPSSSYLARRSQELVLEKKNVCLDLEVFEF